MQQPLKTVSFYGTVSAGSEQTLVSQRISTPYQVEKILAHFPLNQNRTVQLEFFVSPDSDAPSSGKPNGFNILGEYGQVSYIVGDDETKEILCQARAQTSPSWLKVYAVNSDAFDHTIDVQIILSILQRE